MIYQVKIVGLTPYMQHRMDDTKLEQWEKNRGQIIERPEVNHADAVRAEYHCYRNLTTQKCFIPAEHIRQALINGGGYLKSKVGTKTKSMTGIIAAMCMINPEEIDMPDYDTIDKRSAVNKNVKARVMVIRPKWTTWDASFELHIDNESLTDETVADLIDKTGNYVGIGSYRPTSKGFFGRFKLEALTRIS
jgi:hypothetical protein